VCGAHVHLQPLVREVDHQLLEAIGGEDLEAEDVEQPHPVRRREQRRIGGAERRRRAERVVQLADDPIEHPAESGGGGRR
jgi:hypothetical protein